MLSDLVNTDEEKKDVIFTREKRNDLLNFGKDDDLLRFYEPIMYLTPPMSRFIGGFYYKQGGLSICQTHFELKRTL